MNLHLCFSLMDSMPLALHDTLVPWFYSIHEKNYGTFLQAVAYGREVISTFHELSTFHVASSVLNTLCALPCFILKEIL